MKSYPVLDRLHIVDFKGIHDLAISPGRLTVLIGANGVGKSTILEAAALAGRTLTEYLATFEPEALATGVRPEHLERSLSGPWGPRELVRAGAEELRVEVSVGQLEYRLEMPSISRIARVGVRLPNPANPFCRSDAQVLERLTRHARLRLDADRLAMPAELRPTPSLGSDGTGLPAFLQYLQGRRDGTFDKIEASMRSIVPTFRQVRLEPVSWTAPETEVLTIEGQRLPRVVNRERNGLALRVEFADGAVVPAAQVSEGTLLALAIMSLALGSSAQRHHLLLLDDIERGLHPSAQHRLVAALKAVLAEVPDLQILATTHSPDLVDACEPGDVRVLGRGPGGVVARALTEHPEATKWLKLLRVGEFWSTVGEDWVAGTPEPRA